MSGGATVEQPTGARQRHVGGAGQSEVAEPSGHAEAASGRRGASVVGEDRPVSEVIGVAHRRPVVQRTSAATAAELSARSVPLALRQRTTTDGIPPLGLKGPGKAQLLGDR